MTERSPSLRSHTFERVVLMVLAVLLVGGVMGISLALAHYKKLQAARWITLPDGSRVEVVGSTLGGTPFNSEKPWERFARYHLPSAWTGWLPQPLIGGGWADLDSNSLVVYLLVKAPSATVPATYNWDGVQPEDENGFVYWGDRGSSPGPAPIGYTLRKLILRSYPRRQKEFLLRFADFKGTEIGRLRVSNPDLGPFPRWQPVPLPQTQTNGPVILTLDGLGESLMAISRTRPDYGGSNFYHQIIPHTRVTTTVPAWVNAQATDISFCDPTGNKGQNLFRHEPAWKARILVFHNSPEAFGPDQKLVMTNLAIPAPGTYLALNQSANLGGVGLNLRILSGAGELTLSNDNSVFMKAPQSGANGNFITRSSNLGSSRSWEALRPFLMIETTNGLPDDRLEVFLQYDVENDPGISKRIFYGGVVGNRYSNTFMHQIPFRPPQGAKTFSITVIINRPLAFEFMINPADIQVANPPSTH
jgi:hypothetical protein